MPSGDWNLGVAAFQPASEAQNCPKRVGPAYEQVTTGDPDGVTPVPENPAQDHPDKAGCVLTDRVHDAVAVTGKENVAPPASPVMAVPGGVYVTPTVAPAGRPITDPCTDAWQAAPGVGQDQPLSTTQRPEHPSPLTPFPSSQASMPAVRVPSPHTMRVGVEHFVLK